MAEAMSDHLERVEAFLDAREACGEASRGTISVAHGGGSRTGERPGTYRRPLTDADLRALVAELKQLRTRTAGLREEWGYRWGIGELGERAEGYDNEAIARMLAGPRDTIMRRYVTDWEDVAKDSTEDGDRG